MDKRDMRAEEPGKRFLGYGRAATTITTSRTAT